MARSKRKSGRGKYDRSLSAAERKAEQRTKLLDAATQVFATHGYTQSTVNDIIVKAGMSRRTYYEHFADLRDVLAQIYERGAEITYTLVGSSGRAHTDPLASIRAGLAAYLGAVASFPEIARVMFVEYRLAGPDFEKRYQHHSARYAELMLEQVEAAHKAGKLRRKPSELAVFVLTKGIEAAAVRELVRGRANRLPAHLDEFYELVIGSFR